MEEFLKNGNNKEDLFAYLSEGVLTNMDVPETKQLHITYKDSVLSKGGDPTELAPCDHEESDTRVMLHISHAVRGGSRSLFLSTGDSDVVVIATYVFSVLVQDVPDLQIWVLFGQGKDSSVYDIRKIYEFLGPAKCRAMLFLSPSLDAIQHLNLQGKASFRAGMLGYRIHMLQMDSLFILLRI